MHKGKAILKKLSYQESFSNTSTTINSKKLRRWLF